MNQQEYSAGGKYASKFLRELSGLRKLSALCDGTVKLIDGSVKVSRAVLAAGCPYFKVLLEFEKEAQHDLSSEQDAELDITQKTFEMILDYIYTGKITLDCDNIQDILQASDLLLMTDLKELCIQYLMAEIEVENCLGIHQFAQQFSCPRLMYFAEKFIHHHFKHRQIVRTEEFRCLSEERLKKLLSQDGLIVKSELDILTALVVWLNVNQTKNPNVESLVTNCLRESVDLKYDPEFQQALQDLRASKPPWDSPGAVMVLSALKKTPRIRSIRQRGMKTVLVCCDNVDIYLLDILNSSGYGSTYGKLPPMPSPRLKPSLVVEGGFLFALGGADKNRQLKCDVQRYDPCTNSWKAMMPLPYACCSPKVVANAGKIYVTGGNDVNDQELHIDRFEEFDIYTNQWKPLPSLAFPRRGAAMTMSNDKVYYIGGSPWQECADGVPYRRVNDAVDYFSISEEVWAAGPQLKERRSLATAVSFDENIFVIGGLRPIECPSARDSLKVTGTEVLFCVTPQTWTPLGKFLIPNEAKYQPTAVATEDILLLIGKSDPTNKNFNVFTMESMGWVPLPREESENILFNGARRFCSFHLFRLPAAVMQDLQVSCET